MNRSEQIEKELAMAEIVLREGNEGKARVCTRLAVGLATADARLIIDHLMSAYPLIPGVMETMMSVGNMVESEIPQGDRQGGGCDQEGHEGEQEQRESLRSTPWH